jgi:excisionase family DNA binding protein
MSEQTKDHKEKKNDFLTARQLAEILQISQSTIHRLRRQGRIPAIMVTSKLIRFNLREVRAALATEPVEPNSSLSTNKHLNQQLAFEDLFTETFD